MSARQEHHFLSFSQFLRRERERERGEEIPGGPTDESTMGFKPGTGRTTGKANTWVVKAEKGRKGPAGTVKRSSTLRQTERKKGDTARAQRETQAGRRTYSTGGGPLRLSLPAQGRPACRPCDSCHHHHHHHHHRSVSSQG